MVTLYETSGDYIKYLKCILRALYLVVVDTLDSKPNVMMMQKEKSQDQQSRFVSVFLNHDCLPNVVSVQVYELNKNTFTIILVCVSAG